MPRVESLLTRPFPSGVLILLPHPCYDQPCRILELPLPALPVQQTWQEQDSWMDSYRNRLGPQEGYLDRSEEEGEGSGEDG